MIDDGAGFDTAQLSRGGTQDGSGLIVAKERLKAVGGSVQIISARLQGSGSRTLRVPIEV